MSNIIDVTLTDNSDKVLKALDEYADLILEALGGEVVKNATLKAPVDTGLLKNSLTYAIAGKEPQISSYKADHANESGQIKTGEYKGSTTKQGNEKAVYIGTNVEYAAYQELGTSKTKAQAFLKPAVTEHKDEYKEIVKKGLKGEL